MKCEYFSKCASCVVYEIEYKEQVKNKSNKMNALFDEVYNKSIKVFTSKSEGFRIRAEFKIGRNNLIYQMMGENKSFVDINSCSIVDKSISKLMPLLLEEIRASEIIHFKLFRVEFLSSNLDMLVSLIYHKKLDEVWENEVREISSKLNINIIGRSRKQKVVINKDKIKEFLMIDNKKYHYFLEENTFIQPNREINEKIISWLISNIKTSNNKDLLELYCGHGNLTIPLSFHFNKVLATEISKTSIYNAKDNLILNEIKNVEFVKMSSEEISQAIHKERIFFRLRDINLDDYDFSTILVDPPRAGLDNQTINLVSHFNQILYISCNYDTLKRDLVILTKTHTIINMAMFDQFPYTNHIEMGVALKRVSKI